MQVCCDINEALWKRGSFELTPQLRSLLRNYCTGLDVKLLLPDGRRCRARFHRLNATFHSRVLARWLQVTGVSQGCRLLLETTGPDIENVFRVQVLDPLPPEEPDDAGAGDAEEDEGPSEAELARLEQQLENGEVPAPDPGSKLPDPSAMPRLERTPPSFDDEAWEALCTEVEGKGAGDASAHGLALLAERAAARDGFQSLWGLDSMVGVELYEHQLEAVRKVLQDFHGRAILADEVGLGKTIEAGMVISEYRARGLIENCLVLCPASLVRQWQEELRTKFQLEFETHLDSDDWTSLPFLVASLDTAKGARHRQQLVDRRFDMVVVDEAHKLKNQRTRNWRFVRELDSRYLLMLTATPIQNSIEELYNLIYLVRPGLLSTRKSFKSEFMHSRNRRVPRNVERLRDLVGRVMVRSRRAEANISFTDRRVDLVRVDLADREAELYEALDLFIREHYTHIPYFERGMNRLTLMLLERMVTSSPRALAATVGRLLDKGNVPGGFAEELGRIRGLADALRVTAKFRAARQICLRAEERQLIYTQFRDSQEMLACYLEEGGLEVFRFHGGLPVRQKDQVVHRFADSKSGVLISTDAGAEGRNLQFCRRLINFDLPWNPMKVEQRIGRVHRLGQTRDVEIVNLFYDDTIEAYVVRLLTEKIKLFTLVVGELDSILGLARTRTDIETEIMDVFMSTDDRQELDYRFDRLGHHFERAIDDYDEMKDAQNQIFDPST